MLRSRGGRNRMRRHFSNGARVVLRRFNRACRNCGEDRFGLWRYPCLNLGRFFHCSEGRIVSARWYCGNVSEGFKRRSRRVSSALLRRPRQSCQLSLEVDQFTMEGVALFRRFLAELSEIFAQVGLAPNARPDRHQNETEDRKSTRL